MNNRFDNKGQKVQEIVDVVGDEELKVGEIVKRLNDKGYKVTAAELPMWLYNNMLHKKLKRRKDEEKGQGGGWLWTKI